jgi:hypothetical protein
VKGTKKFEDGICNIAEFVKMLRDETIEQRKLRKRDEDK